MKARVQRRWIAWIVLVAVLFTQFAVAVYACPALAMVADSCDAMAAKANQPDPDNPGLCLQHCQQGSQHSDHAAVPPILSMLGLMPLVDGSHHSPSLPVMISAQARALARASPPPKSILHCC